MTFKEKFNEVLLGWLKIYRPNAVSINSFDDDSDCGCGGCSCAYTTYTVNIYYTDSAGGWNTYKYDGHFSELLEQLLEIDV